MFEVVTLLLFIPKILYLWPPIYHFCHKLREVEAIILSNNYIAVLFRAYLEYCKRHSLFGWNVSGGTYTMRMSYLYLLLIIWLLSFLDSSRYQSGNIYFFIWHPHLLSCCISETLNKPSRYSPFKYFLQGLWIHVLVYKSEETTCCADSKLLW